MRGDILGLEILIYSLALWLGLYLIARNPANPRLRWAGLGLAAYALSLATDLLGIYAPPIARQALTRLHQPLLLFPALFWLGVVIRLLPEGSSLQTHLDRLWRYGLLPASGLFYLFSVFTNLSLDFTVSPARPGPVYLILAGAILLPMLVALTLVGRIFYGLTRLTSSRWPQVPRNSLGLILAATLFFTLGAGLLIFPFAWLPRLWLLAAIGGDLILLGLAVAWLDAFDEGEALWPDFLRSLDYSLLNGLLFGGLVGITMLWDGGVTFSMLALLLAIIAAAITTQTFADALQTILDRLVFARVPSLWQARAQLRATTNALPRLNKAIDFETLDEAEFIRLTRRALSHWGDLPRLAVSPLTRLSLLEARLAARHAPDNTLERAAELKTILAESIARLKPRGQGDFGASEAWRYYNALYFPYVAGLKPYSQWGDGNGLDPAAHQALEWFQTQVPERTLHNWQNAAARLVAQDLREQLKQAKSSK
jgi:hypothetical protein